MVKKQAFILILFLLYVTVVNAQILNIEKLAPTLNLSDNFLNSLEKCTNHESEKSAFLDGADSRLSYKIEKKNNNTCSLQVVADTDHYVHIEQNCIFPMNIVKEYAVALRRFNEKKYSLFKDTFLINKDEDYQKATEIMQNLDFCRFKRSKIDNTKEIRENLPRCYRTKSEEFVENAIVTREIVGRDKDFNCGYHYTIWRPETTIEKKFFANVRNMFIPSNEMKFHYLCSFDTEQKKEYLLLLESLVLPEEEGENFTAVSNFSSKIELEFIINNCEYIVDSTKK